MLCVCIRDHSWKLILSCHLVGSGHQTQVIRPLPNQLRLLRLIFRSILVSCFCGHHVPSVNTEHKAFSLAFTCKFGECAPPCFEVNWYTCHLSKFQIGLRYLPLNEKRKIEEDTKKFQRGPNSLVQWVLSGVIASPPPPQNGMCGAVCWCFQLSHLKGW